MAKARPITGIDAQASTGKNARIIARTRLEEMESWGQYAHDPQRTDELHNLRIAAKRLRYTLEIFADALPKECEAFVEEVTQIQEELGSLHDGDVMIALLRSCLDFQHDENSGTERNTNGKQALAVQAQQKAGKHLIANLDLVTYLVDPRAMPSQAERKGLERLLLDIQQRREEQYAAFRRHWDQLQTRDFFHELLSLLDA